MTEVKFEVFGQKELAPREFLKILLDQAVSRVNTGASKTLTARLTSEKPPRDSRHLTDTRTRVSTLLEYSIAYEINELLSKEPMELSLSAVLWNVFPDLLIRDKNREPLLGLEVKALHTAAEEKSANLATPISIIGKNEDYLVILLWGWQSAQKGGVSITYPHIHAVDVFDAWLLAKMRDYGWLMNHGNRVKGIDLCSPIINGDGNGYKAEEGNLGKLMRIGLPSNAPDGLADIRELKSEFSRYESFLQLILALALRETFSDVCAVDGVVPDEQQDVMRYPDRCCVVGRAVCRNGQRLLLIAGSSQAGWLNGEDLQHEAIGTCCLWLGQKLNWIVYEKTGSGWVNKGSGDKPDSDLDAIHAAIKREVS